MVPISILPPFCLATPLHPHLARCVRVFILGLISQDCRPCRGPVGRLGWAQALALLAFLCFLASFILMPAASATGFPSHRGVQSFGSHQHAVPPLLQREMISLTDGILWIFMSGHICSGVESLIRLFIFSSFGAAWLWWADSPCGVSSPVGTLRSRGYGWGHPISGQPHSPPSCGP